MQASTPAAILHGKYKDKSNRDRNGNHHEPVPPQDERFARFAAKLKAAGEDPVAIRAFRYYYTQLVSGANGQLTAAEAQPVEDLPLAVDLPVDPERGRAALAKTVVIKLNGGLGTTMGMHGPKSLIQVKEGLTFLDIIVRQIIHRRAQSTASLPLVLMNSFNTEAATEAALANYPELRQDVPVSFRQHQVPRIWADELSPVEWPADRSREWCPPGHGDLYLAIQTTGLLSQLLAAGYEYAFISNSDNLGATVDLEILGYFAEQRLPFLMEVTRRRPSDRKGGHLAWHPQAGLILREIAQCPPDEMEQFQDITRYRYFNTNNLWVNLVDLQTKLHENDGLLELPLLRNEKPVEPSDPTSRRVYQLETAMGHAIALFPKAKAIEVSRQRFLPVKDTNDLLALWSDVYCLNDDFTIVVNPERTLSADLAVDLDPEHYGLFEQLERHFCKLPSLVNCARFRLRGDIYFDAPLALAGDVSLSSAAAVPVRWAEMTERA